MRRNSVGSSHKHVDVAIIVWTSTPLRRTRNSAGSSHEHADAALPEVHRHHRVLRRELQRCSGGFHHQNSLRLWVIARRMLVSYWLLAGGLPESGTGSTLDFLDSCTT